MLPDSPIVRRVLAIAAVVLVVTALATVVVAGGSGDDDALTAGASTSTTNVPSSAAAAGTAAPSPSETSAAPTTEAPPETVGAAGGGAEPAEPTTSPPATDPGSEPAAAPDPGPNTPPQAGTYVYTFSREGGEEGSRSGERNTVVEDAGESGGERRQRIRQEDEQGSFVSDVAWRADGLYVLKTTFSFGDQSSECDWQPDFRMLATPLAPGTTWTYETSCTATFQGTPVKIDRTGEFTVVEATRVDVGGTTVDVWTIQSVEHTAFGAFGSAKEETTAYFSPRHGLPVKSLTKASGSGQGESSTVTEESEIKNLSPQ